MRAATSRPTYPYGLLISVKFQHEENVKQGNPDAPTNYFLDGRYSIVRIMRHCLPFVVINCVAIGTQMTLVVFVCSMNVLYRLHRHPSEFLSMRTAKVVMLWRACLCHGIWLAFTLDITRSVLQKCIIHYISILHTIYYIMRYI